MGLGISLRNHVASRHDANSTLRPHLPLWSSLRDLERMVVTACSCHPPLRVLPVLLGIQQLSPRGLPLPGGPALPSFLPACNGELQQDLSDGAGWFLPHVRIINVKSLNHILPPGEWLCYCRCLVALALRVGC